MAEESGNLSGSTGVFSNCADELRPQTALKVGNNVSMTRMGVISPRYAGCTRQRETVFNGGDEYYGYGTYSDKVGNEYLLQQVGDELQHYNVSTQTEAVIKTGLVLTVASGRKALACLKMFVPYSANDPFMVYTNGIDIPQKITEAAGVFTPGNLQLNGVNFGSAALGANLAAKTPSTPRYCEPFLDRMVFCGFAGQSAYDVLFTNAGSTEACTQAAPAVATDGGLVQLDPQLGAVTGCKAFRISNDQNDQILLIGQERGVSYATGTNATNFKCYTLTAEFGIPSNNAWIQLNSDLWFLSTDGWRSFGNTIANSTLQPSSMTYPIQDLISRINPAQAYQAHAVHHKKYMEIQVWVPIDGDTECKNAFVFNYNTGGDPAHPQPIIFTKDGFSLACSIYFGKEMYGGTYDGLIQQFYTGNTYDGDAMTWQITPALIRGGDPECSYTVEKLTVCADGPAQKFVVNQSYYARTIEDGFIGSNRFDSNPIDYEYNTGAVEGSVLGTWVLGSSGLPAEIPRRFDFMADGEGYAFEVSLSGNTTDHILDWTGIYYRLESGSRET